MPPKNYSNKQLPMKPEWKPKHKPGWPALPRMNSAILGPRTAGMHMPDDVVLRRYFRATIWPALQNTKTKDAGENNLAFSHPSLENTSNTEHEPETL